MTPIGIKRKVSGRPRAVVLSDETKAIVQQTYLCTNRTHRDGSMLMTTDLLADKIPGLAEQRESARISGSVPVAIVEACRHARALVPLHRQGERGLRAAGPYTPGKMRVHWTGERRLFAGERFSWDDMTRNVPCWIPWPWGGDECSDKYGRMLGRWQLLACLDDATSMFIAWSSVFRPAQSYRAMDVAGTIFRTERDVCRADCHVVEGGSWQSERVKQLLAGRWIDAKGRPNQKLIENRFNVLQTAMSANGVDVGRWRGEMKKESDIYVKCRRGKADPADYFLALEPADAALEACFHFINGRPVRSRQYGTWIPAERWALDMAQHPRPTSAEELGFLAAPVAEQRVIRRSMITCTADGGPFGMKFVFQFTAPWLWEHDGRPVDIYFDPLGEWPVRAIVTKRASRIPLGEVECANPLERGAEKLAASVRQAMRSEYRTIFGARESHVRGPSGTATVKGGTRHELVMKSGLGARALDAGARQGEMAAASVPRSALPLPTSFESRIESGRDEGRAAYLAQFRADASAFRAGTDDDAPPTARRLDAAAFIDTNP